MRKRDAPMEVYFLTDPLCPWSWAMDPVASSLRADEGLQFRSIIAGWLPSLEARGVEAVKAEWSDAAAKTGAQIDPAYWDRVAPKTGLVAGAAAKAAEFQGMGKGDAYLSAVRRAAFEAGEDVTSFDVLAGTAKSTGLRDDLFRIDLGVGRYTVEDVLQAIDPSMPLSESVWWFGRRKMLRCWDALSENLRAVERQEISPPAFHIIHGKEDTVVQGFVTEVQVRGAIESVR